MRFSNFGSKEAVIALALLNGLALVLIALYFTGVDYVAPVLCVAILTTAMLNLFPRTMLWFREPNVVSSVLKPIIGLVFIPIVLIVTGAFALFLGAAGFVLNQLAVASNAMSRIWQQSIKRLNLTRVRIPMPAWKTGSGSLILANALATVVIMLSLLGFEFAPYLVIAAALVMAFYLFCNFILSGDPKEE